VLDLRSYLPYLINRVGFAVTDVFGEALATENLTVPMWRVLAVLLHHGPQRIGDLADLTSIEISTLSRLLGSMQRRKLLNRRRARTDARVVMVALTELETSLAGDLTGEEIATLKRTLDKLYANISRRASEHRLKA
jgi:DNA-binding MarR family transcriptional regulator